MSIDAREYYAQKFKEERNKLKQIEYEIDFFQRRKKAVKRNMVRYCSRYNTLVTNKPIVDL